MQCNWDTEDDAPKISTATLASAPGSGASSMRSGKLASVPKGLGLGSAAASTVSVPQTAASPKHPIRVSYLTEQTSHHPPVSAFYISCPERGLHARGYDQITAKFTGTSIKVMPGEHNLGIFITLEKRDNETYQLTHPPAHLGGLLRGALNITVGEQAYISCPQTKLKCILRYYDEGWTRSVNKVEGIIFRYDPDDDDKTNIKDVPEDDILVRLGGPWKEQTVFTLGPKPVVSLVPAHCPHPLVPFPSPFRLPVLRQHLVSQDSHPPENQTTLVDVAPLSVAPKTLPPEDKQLANESLTLWGPVTRAIHSKQFSRATHLKQELEEQQREKARQREQAGETWKPIFFTQVTDKGGRPELTDKGREVLKLAQEGVWDIKALPVE